jgi:hypothetical protein
MPQLENQNKNFNRNNAGGGIGQNNGAAGGPNDGKGG